MMLIEKHIKGFSMVELSLVIAIMSVVIAGTLGASTKYREDARIKASEEKIDYIMQAIKNFIDEFGYIPCPADPTLTFSNGNFGFSDYSDTDDPLIPADAPMTCDAPNVLSETTSNAVAGAIPVYTLNISPDYIFDSWYNRFTYIVDEDLTFVGNAATNGYIDTGTAGDISVQNIGMTNSLRDDAAVIIISHGNNGHGAWRGAGGSSRITVAGINDTDAEGENSHVVSELSFDNSFVQSIGTGNIDDILEYKTKWQLNAN